MSRNAYRALREAAECWPALARLLISIDHYGRASSVQEDLDAVPARAFTNDLYDTVEALTRRQVGGRWKLSGGVGSR